MLLSKILYLYLVAHVSSSGDSSAACDSADFKGTNPFIGSSGVGLWAEGGMSPAAQVPYGAFRLGPDTTTLRADGFLRHTSGYNSRDTSIRAFSHTRCVGAGVSDYGSFGIMPIRHNVSAVQDDLDYMSWWSNKDINSETAFPGHYSVYLSTPKVKAEMVAASEMAGAHRYTWVADTEISTPGLIIDLCHQATIAHVRDACQSASFKVIEPSHKNGYTPLAAFSGSIRSSGPLSNFLSDGFGKPSNRTTMNVYVYGEVVDKSRIPAEISWSVCKSSDTNISIEGNTSTILCSTKIQNGMELSSDSGILYSRLLIESPLRENSEYTLDVLVGISFIDTHTAALNLQLARDRVDKENGLSSTYFEEFSKLTCDIWMQEFSLMDLSVENSIADRFGGTDELISIFFTAYYRYNM